jgi:hypothetical protein
MPIIKDLTFNYDGSGILDNAIDDVTKLSFVRSYEFVSKFTSEEKNTYSIRFYLQNKEGIKNEEIDSMVREIVSLFESNGFKI